MKVALATVQVPFISGGAEIQAQSLKQALIDRKVEADIVSIPFKWYPPSCLLDVMLMARLMDLSQVNGIPIDRVITLKFPAYYVDHPNKVGWIIHQHRQAYDLYDTPFGDLHQTEEGRSVTAQIRKWDTKFLPEHKSLFAESGVVRDRMRRFNGIESEPLYHPPANPERFRRGEFENFVLAPGRIDPIKRQHLVIEALTLLPPAIKLVLIGSSDSDYGRQAREMAERLGTDRVVVRGIVSEAEKIDLYSRCLAVYNGVYDEDYGYITLEGFLAGKPVIAHPDAGGPLEFITHEQNGFIVPPEAAEIAAVIAKLAKTNQKAREIGAAGRETIERLGVGWDNVVDRLLA